MSTLLANQSVQVLLFLAFALLIGWLRRPRHRARHQDLADTRADAAWDQPARRNEALRALTLQMYRDRNCPYPAGAAVPNFPGAHSESAVVADAATGSIPAVVAAPTPGHELASFSALVRARRRIKPMKTPMPKASRRGPCTTAQRRCE